MTINHQFIKYTVFAVALFSFNNISQAITRMDVLECGLSDGSKFILKSSYDWSLIPLPMGHNGRESNRRDWIIVYQEKKGRQIEDLNYDLDYYGKNESMANSEGSRKLLTEACAHFGIINNIIVIPGRFLKEDGTWFSKKDFPVDRLSINSFKLNAAQKIQFESAGIKRTSDFSYILPKNGRLIYEKPLYAIESSYRRYDLEFDAVYQSFSNDNGKTWSDPIVTRKAEIVEIGKSFIEQSFRARPIKLNGKKIDP